MAAVTDLSPYRTEVVDDGALRLRLAGVSLWSQVYLLRVMPVLVIALSAVVVAEWPKNTPWWALPGLAIVAGLAVYWLSLPIILGSRLSGRSVEVRTNHLFGNRTTAVDLARARSMQMRVQPRPRGGRVTYRLILQDGRAVDFAHFPVAIAFDEPVFKARSLVFQELTGLPLTVTFD